MSCARSLEREAEELRAVNSALQERLLEAKAADQQRLNDWFKARVRECSVTGVLLPFSHADHAPSRRPRALHPCRAN